MQLNFKKIGEIIFVIVFIVFLIASKAGKNTDSDFASPISKNAKSEEINIEIKGDDSWKPKGWGSGEYLQDLPIIKAGAVVDLTSGDVIWSMNLKDKIAPASLTKIATVMTALDIASPQKTIYVNEEASSQIPTKLGLRTGEKLTLSEAISASILTSANDASEAISQTLGREIGGSGTESFMGVVNRKMQKIGARDTHFETSTGLDSQNHFSTIYDLAIIAHNAKFNYPEIGDAADDSYRRLEANADHKLFDLPNWNALLGTYPGVNGLKIGYTENAGHSTMVTANRNGNELVAIIIGAQSIEDREKAAAVLLNYGFGKYGIEQFPVENLDLVSRFEDWRRQLTLAN